jgi:RimJ/RimL family protein N-acetyltransferase
MRLAVCRAGRQQSSGDGDPKSADGGSHPRDGTAGKVVRTRIEVHRETSYDPPVQPVLRTARLSLRPITEDDAALLFELDSDPEVMRWLSGGPGTPLEKIESDILPRFLGYPALAPWGGAWMAFERHGGEFAGWFSLRPSEDTGQGPELGYRLRRPMWGHGLATEGSSELLRYAFERHCVERVFATTYEFNTGSRRVLEKLGMRHVRSYRLEDEETAPATFAAEATETWDGDEVEYEITRSEWETRQPAGRNVH